jgi:hypothetical protein
MTEWRLTLAGYLCLMGGAKAAAIGSMHWALMMYLAGAFIFTVAIGNIINRSK